ncbi:MAG: hypothetical protein M3N98_05255, partial [Actinomycetota bacterium]|nr:hypothetical protein [Actinomycetota bacterium]
AMGRLLWPLVMAVIGVLPVLAARDAFRRHLPVVPALVFLEQLVAVVVIGFLAWIRYQADAHSWFQNQMSEVAKTTKTRTPTQ